MEEYVKTVHEDFMVARWAEVPAEIWSTILLELPDLKEEVVLNKKLPDPILEELSKDEDSRVRGLVAMKRQLSHGIFLRLATDECEGVRMSVARNRKTPVDVLELMRRDSWSRIVDVVQERLSKG